MDDPVERQIQGQQVRSADEWQVSGPCGAVVGEYLQATTAPMQRLCLDPGAWRRRRLEVRPG